MIGGEKQNELEEWSPLSKDYTVSLGCSVKKLPGKTEIKVKKKKALKEL